MCIKKLTSKGQGRLEGPGDDSHADHKRVQLGAITGLNPLFGFKIHFQYTNFPLVNSRASFICLSPLTISAPKHMWAAWHYQNVNDRSFFGDVKFLGGFKTF